VIGDNMSSIQVVTAPQLTAGEPFVAVRFTNAQMIAIQATAKDAWVAYSEGGLTSTSTRFKLSQFDSPDGSGDSGMVLTFPHTPYTGELWFASAGNADSLIHVWTVTCGSVY